MSRQNYMNVLKWMSHFEDKVHEITLIVIEASSMSTQ